MVPSSSAITSAIVLPPSKKLISPKTSPESKRASFSFLFSEFFCTIHEPFPIWWILVAGSPSWIIISPFWKVLHSDPLKSVIQSKSDRISSWSVFRVNYLMQ